MLLRWKRNSPHRSFRNKRSDWCRRSRNSRQLPRVQSPTTLTVRETGSAGRKVVSSECPPPVSILRLGTVIFGSFFAGYGAFPAVLCSGLCVSCPSEAAELLLAWLHAREPKIITRSRRTAPATQSAAIIFLRAVPVITGFFVYVFSVSVSGLSCVF